MEKSDLEQRLHLLEKQVESTIAIFQETKFDLLSAIDSLKIEVETLRVLLQRKDPELHSLYAKLKEEVTEKMNPEWQEPAAGKPEK